MAPLGVGRHGGHGMSAAAMVRGCMVYLSLPRYCNLHSREKPDKNRDSLGKNDTWCNSVLSLISWDELQMINTHLLPKCTETHPLFVHKDCCPVWWEVPEYWLQQLTMVVLKAIVPLTLGGHGHLWLIYCYWNELSDTNFIWWNHMPLFFSCHTINNSSFGW